MAASTSANLSNLIDATTQWHRIFASDRVRAHFQPHFVSELELFVGEARMIRWGLVATPEKVNEIWQGIMPGSAPTEEGEVPEAPAAVNENIVDYVLNGAAYVSLKADIGSGHMETFLSDLAHSLCWPFKAQYIDDEMKDRAADPEFLKKLFSGSAWALFVYLISVSPLEFSDDPLVFGPTSSKGDNES